MPPDLIVCLRHAEKPANADGKPEPPDDEGPGLDLEGRENPHSLTLRGWQRAGALAATELCHCLEKRPVTILVPDYDHSSHHPPHHPSVRTTEHRPYQTVCPLAARLRVAISHPVDKEHVDDLKDEVLRHDGTVVVCWEHDNLARFVNEMTKPKKDEEWPSGRFDLLWLLTGSRGVWKLKPQNQALLAGDEGLAT
jgi:hypothetical protein